MSGSPMESFLGRAGEPVQCKVISADVSVHWFPTGARPGDRCLCGLEVKRDDEDDA